MEPATDELSSPYIYRDEQEPAAPVDPEGRDIVIADGQAMSYRFYRR